MKTTSRSPLTDDSPVPITPGLIMGAGTAGLAALSQVRQAWLGHRVRVEEEDMKRRLGIAVLMSGLSRIRVFNKNVVTIDPEGIRLEVFFGLFLPGLIGSRLLSHGSFHGFDLLALIIIILEMVVGVVPGAISQIELPRMFANYMQPIILVPIILFYFAPNYEGRKQKENQIDLMHGLLVATLVFIVLLGGIVTNILYSVEYIDGLLLTVFIVSTLTMGISWFRNPGGGFSVTQGEKHDSRNRTSPQALWENLGIARTENGLGGKSNQSLGLFIGDSHSGLKVIKPNFI